MNPVKCIFVGDIALGDHPKSVGFGFYSRYRDGIPSDKAHALFRKGYEHDILFGNLEFTLGTAELTAASHEELNCRGIAAFADFLQQAGFNAVNIANNHIYQHGAEPFDKTVKVLAGKGIGIVGLGRDGSSSSVIGTDDRSVCFLGWSARPRQGFSDQPPYREFDEASCYGEITDAAKTHSVVCASLHWGDEFIEIPSEDERRIARRMIDAGAKVVVGHHPHVMREVEEYSGGLIAYSLGNFICDMVWNESTRKTGYLYVEFTDGAISKWEIVHGRIGDDYLPDFNGLVPDPSDTYRQLNSRLTCSSYDHLARQALRRHQVLTILHMIRNCGKYRSGVWRSMLMGAIKSRLITIR
jgi:hypothetical protein